MGWGKKLGSDQSANGKYTFFFCLTKSENLGVGGGGGVGSSSSDNSYCLNFTYILLIISYVTTPPPSTEIVWGVNEIKLKRGYTGIYQKKGTKTKIRGGGFKSYWY